MLNSVVNWIRLKLLGIAILITCLGVIVIITYLIMLCKNYHLGNSNINISETGAVGDFVGGFVGTLFSLAGFVVVYYTFKDQKEANENEKIESRFFELVKLHKENVAELVFRDWKSGFELSTGRAVFKTIYEQLHDAIIITTKILNLIGISESVKPNSFIDLYSDMEDVQKELIIGNLAYSIVFFGVAEESFEGLSNVLKKDFKDTFVEKYIAFFRLIPVKGSIYRERWANTSRSPYFNKTIEKHFIKENLYTAEIFYKSSSLKKYKFYKYFGGHQAKLGHYYRHLFRTASYIDSKNITYAQKEEYIRLLRAQLSNYEQFLLFFNSICFIGRAWELNHRDDEIKKLVSKYDLIRNIPYTKYKYEIGKDEHSIDLKNFYPLVAYEFENVPSGKEQFKQRLEKANKANVSIP